MKEAARNGTKMAVANRQATAAVHTYADTGARKGFKDMLNYSSVMKESDEVYDYYEKASDLVSSVIKLPNNARRLNCNVCDIKYAMEQRRMTAATSGFYSPDLSEMHLIKQIS